MTAQRVTRWTSDDTKKSILHLDANAIISTAYYFIMHFGKTLISQRYEPWAAHYLQYNALKSLLEDDTLLDESSSRRARNVSPDFVDQLNQQVEHTVHFFLQQQGAISSGLTQLDQNLVQVQSLPQWNELYKDYTSVAQQVLYLVQFVDLNVTGIRKILKKHDRITHQKLSAVYLSNSGRHSNLQKPVLRPLLEDGGLEALHVTLSNAFETLYRLKQTFQSYERWNTWSDASEGSDSMQMKHASSMSERVSTYNSIERRPTTPAILLKIEAARRRLQQNSRFVHMLAAPLILDGQQDDEASTREPMVKDRSRIISNYLNFCSTFLHMTDYYIVAPTSGSYAAKLGDTAALAGLIIGLNSVSALVSTILYSWWTSYTYKRALIFASTCQLVGCLVYASALPMQSLTCVIVGRLIGGFGSARSINRRYIADTYPSQERTAASAAFVASGALGTSTGPALAALLYLTVPKGSDNLYWQVENSVGWIMALLWTVYVICLIYYFEEPPRPKPHHPETQLELPSVTGEKQALLADKTNGSTSEPPEPPLWRNVPVATTFFVYFVLKFILESLLSSTAILTDFYFGWSGSMSGFWLAVLGLLVLPANWVIAMMSRMLDDRELMLATEILMFLGCVTILQYGENYTIPHYLLGSILIFVSANSLEGPNMSLLSKTIPVRYSRGLFNVGLLATESGTLGRAVGDVILTLCGSQGLQHILNNAFGAMSALSMATIALTWFMYDRLEPHEKDD